MVDYNLTNSPTVDYVYAVTTPRICQPGEKGRNPDNSRTSLCFGLDPSRKSRTKAQDTIPLECQCVYEIYYFD